MLRIIKEALTFDDVLLVPRHSTVLPNEVSLKTRLTRNVSLNIPLVSSAMDTVSEARLAIALAQEGGMAFIHKNMPIAEQARHVRQVKRYESGIVHDPITVSPNTSIAEVKRIAAKKSISGMPVIDGDELVGIVTNRDVRFAFELTAPVSSVMTTKENLVTVTESASREEILSLLNKHRIERILVVTDDNKLAGLITVKDMIKAESKPSACKDEQGHLRVGAAVGTGADTDERVDALVEAGVDVILVDTSHGHSQGVLNRVKAIKQKYPKLELIGGNVATAEGALALAEAGADAVKVGIGPGSICTTRIVTGVGVPQISAIADSVEALRRLDIPVIADGGIRFSGDLCKALAAGASCCMVGSMLAGTEEAPGEIEIYQGRSYKSYRGMGSLGAMNQNHGSSDRYFQAENDAEKLVPEGIEGRVPYKGSLINIVHQIVGGLRSSMGLTGSGDIDALRTTAEFVRVSAAGMRESHVHDVTITKEAPNYRL